MGLRASYNSTPASSKRGRRSNRSAFALYHSTRQICAATSDGISQCLYHTGEADGDNTSHSPELWAATAQIITAGQAILPLVGLPASKDGGWGAVIPVETRPQGRGHVGWISSLQGAFFQHTVPVHYRIVIRRTCKAKSQGPPGQRVHCRRPGPTVRLSHSLLP